MEHSPDIIPTTDTGTFRITDRMIMESGAVSMGAFEHLLRHEARVRGLDLRIERETSSQDVLVSWRPEPAEWTR